MNTEALIWGAFAVNTLVLVPLIALLVLSLRKVPRKAEVAHYGFKWFLATLGIYLGAFIIYTIAYILEIVPLYAFDIGEAHFAAMVRLGTIADFAATVGNAALLITIASIGRGIAVSSTGVVTRKIFYIGIKVLALIISIMALTYFIRTQYYMSQSWQRWNMDWLRDTLRVNGILAGVTAVLTLVGALIVLGHAIVVRIESSKAAGATLQTVTTLLITAATINLILRGFAMWQAAEEFQGLNTFSQEWFISNPVVNRWGTFSVLVALYLLGTKKEGGLWSKHAKEYSTGQV